jgi:hypothetical protein
MCAPISTGNVLQDLTQLCKNVDNNEHYIQVTYINTLKFN